MQYTEDEICATYRDAKHKSAQVQILADLNQCSPRVIIDVLTKRGMLTGLPTNKKASRYGKTDSERTVWTEQMDNQLRALKNEGLKQIEIAERMGLTKSAVQNRARRLDPKEVMDIPAEIPPVIIPETVSQQPTPSNPTESEYDPLVYEAFDLAIAYLHETGAQPQMIWRRLLRKVESYIENLSSYLRMSEKACRCAVELAALAAIEEVKD